MKYSPVHVAPGHATPFDPNALACRPFDAAKQTNTSGGWEWVNVPQSTLLNGHGYYGDCALLAGSNTEIAPKCNVTLQWVPPGRSSVLPYNSPRNPGVRVNPAAILMQACTGI